MVTILPFQPSDQDAARVLVLAGLVEHWGWLDESKNPDLDDIASSYAKGCFLCAWQNDRLVATGALLPADKPDTWQVVRMSVAADCRRTGLGKQMLAALEQEARLRRARRLLLETTATWHDVIAFYLRCGYRIIPTSQFFESMLGGDTGDVYFEKDLN